MGKLIKNTSRILVTKNYAAYIISALLAPVLMAGVGHAFVNNNNVINTLSGNISFGANPGVNYNVGFSTTSNGAFNPLQADSNGGYSYKFLLGQDGSYYTQLSGSNSLSSTGGIYYPNTLSLISVNPFISITNTDSSNPVSTLQNFNFPTNKLTIQVNKSDNSPASNISVAITQLSNSTIDSSDGQPWQVNSLGLSGTTDSNGSLIAGLFSGATYQVCAQFNLSSVPVCTNTLLTLGSDGNVTITLPTQLFSLSGQISFNSNPNAYANTNNIPLMQLFDSTSQKVVSTSAAGGSFLLNDIANGSYTTFIGITMPASIGESAASGMPDQFNLTSVSPDTVINGANITGQNYNFTTYKLTVLSEDANNNPVPGTFTAYQVDSNDHITSTSGESFNVNSIQSSANINNNGLGTVSLFPGVAYRICGYYSDAKVICSNPNVSISANTAFTLFNTVNPPTNLNYSLTTLQPSLKWDANSSANSFNIYRNGVYIGSSSTNSYIDTTTSVNTTYSYYVKAINFSGESTPSNTINVTTATPPSITSPTLLNIDSRSIVSFNITTISYPVTSIAESGTLPPGLRFTDNGDGTASISGQATSVKNGKYSVMITATNIVGSSTQNLVLRVIDVPSVPTIISPDSISATFGTLFSFTINTTGFPLPRINIFGDLPDGLSFKNNWDGTATISGKIRENRAGTYFITVMAKNEQGLSKQTLKLSTYFQPTQYRWPSSNSHRFYGPRG